MSREDGDRIEHQLFEHDGCEQVDDEAYSFERPTLVVALGPFAIGTTFHFALIDYELAIVKFYTNEADEIPACSAYLDLSARWINPANGV